MVTLAHVDQSHTGDRSRDTAANGIELGVVKHSCQAGVVLLPRRWVVERSFAWMARDYEGLPETAAVIHLAGLVMVVLRQALPHLAASP